MQGANEKNKETGSPDESQKNKRGQSVGLRWLTAGVVIPVVLLLVLLGGWWAFAGTLLVVVVCSFELHRMFVHAGYRPLIWASLGLSVLFLIAAMFSPPLRLAIIEIGLAATLLIAFPSTFFRQKLEGVMVDWALTVATAVYLGWPLSHFLLIRGDESGIVLGQHGIVFHLSHGIFWMLALLVGVWGFDSAAFFFGRYFGRHKLAPRISPGKTWEGVLGGLVVSIMAELLITVGPLGVPWYMAILLGTLVGIAAVLGDLAESLIKRQTNVKDSGQIMPGHGGLLDRVDSQLFAVLVVYAFALVYHGVSGLF